MPGEEDDYDEETETDGAEDMDTYLNDNGINTSEGLNYCGNDPDFYKEILGDYVSSFEDRKNELDSALRSNDMSMYAIKVHALKSVAKTVGDRKVFEMALDLEMDSKAGNSEKVTGKHNGLIEEYEKKTEIVKKALSL
jgi:HPt (histidine-containing phosphotransfer) domain-containing protein